MWLLRTSHDLWKKKRISNWHSARPVLVFLLFAFLLTGPLLLFAWWIQDWCAASAWDSEDRWSGTRAFAVTFALVYLVLFWAHPHLWPLFTVWLWCLPLSPTLALLFEWLDPRTRSLKRIPLPAEMPQSDQTTQLPSSFPDTTRPAALHLEPVSASPEPSSSQTLPDDERDEGESLGDIF